MNQKGFTLIEVLIAVVLLAIISFLVYQSMGAMVGSKERFETREDAYRSANVFMDRLTRELATAVLYGNVELLGVSPNGEQSSKSVFSAENNGDQDKLTFDTLSHTRYLKDAKESDLAEVTYFLETQEDGDGLYAVKRRLKCPLDAEPGEKGQVTVLMTGVKELNFRYYDAAKTEYKDEWDTTKLDFANRLPRAVEITLVLQDPVDEDNSLRFMTVALLEMSPGPNDF
ncbi:MAG TPA: type II secretion system protein GspJ [bacterium]|nr:type II secretion system protein GspJ [bacterium]